MKIKAVKTIKGQTPFAKNADIETVFDDDIESPLITLHPDIEYQEIKGFGGAFTEAAAVTLAKLGKENQNRIIKLYFDEESGIGYNFGRVHMNSCDFSEGNYACTKENDNTLETFNIERDKQAIIPMIKNAMEYSKDLEVFVSPWSPPAYMKTNGEMNNGGKLKEEYFELWAEHFVKFINAYRNMGINVTTASVQNEAKATQKWDSCVYTAEEERDFVKNYLGKKMADNNVKLLFWDHNKEHVVERARVMLDDEDAAKYIGGIAFHWYSGDHFEQLEMAHKLYPNIDLVFSEGCYEYSLGKSDTVKIGEKYAHDMIGNFNNYCNIFCDWNLLLDEKGGPNHVGNFCDAPIMADTKNDRIYIHDSYYYIGHFSKYIKKGARRIGSSKWSDSLDTVSFKNPDGEIITVVLNRSDKNENFSILIGTERADLKAEAHSIATYIIK
ncbi:MAG: glycoside hydrolase family 30 protein [Clostridia bacterium]|nr:glycoside hydrolase family 30 protein [Clostridia bacterium]